MSILKHHLLHIIKEYSKRHVVRVLKNLLINQEKVKREQNVDVKDANMLHVGRDCAWIMVDVIFVRWKDAPSVRIVEVTVFPMVADVDVLWKIAQRVHKLVEYVILMVEASAVPPKTVLMLLAVVDFVLSMRNK
jgi:hypothetical protein